MSFRVPNKEKYKRETRFWIDENGDYWRSMGNICWFTNLEHSKRNEELILWKPYSVNEYEKFDNYDVVNVDKVKDIPADYYNAMGVPITFLHSYNPKQFEILDANDMITNKDTPHKIHGLIKDKDGTINGKPKYVRVVIRRRTNEN